MWEPRQWRLRVSPARALAPARGCTRVKRGGVAYRSGGRWGSRLRPPSAPLLRGLGRTGAAAGETRARLGETALTSTSPGSLHCAQEGRLTQQPGCGGQEAGVPSGLPPPPGHGCSQAAAAAFPTRAPPGEPSPFPAAWPPSRPPPPAASVARVPAGAAPPRVRDQPKPLPAAGPARPAAWGLDPGCVWCGPHGREARGEMGPRPGRPGTAGEEGQASRSEVRPHTPMWVLAAPALEGAPGPRPQGGGLAPYPPCALRSSRRPDVHPGPREASSIRVPRLVCTDGSCGREEPARATRPRRGPTGPDPLGAGTSRAATERPGGRRGPVPARAREGAARPGQSRSAVPTREVTSERPRPRGEGSGGAGAPSGRNSGSFRTPASASSTRRPGGGGRPDTHRAFPGAEPKEKSGKVGDRPRALVLLTWRRAPGWVRVRVRAPRLQAPRPPARIWAAGPAPAPPRRPAPPSGARGTVRPAPRRAPPLGGRARAGQAAGKPGGRSRRPRGRPRPAGETGRGAAGLAGRSEPLGPGAGRGPAPRGAAWRGRPEVLLRQLSSPGTSPSSPVKWAHGVCCASSCTAQSRPAAGAHGEGRVTGVTPAARGEVPGGARVRPGLPNTLRKGRPVWGGGACPIAWVGGTEAAEPATRPEARTWSGARGGPSAQFP